MGWFKSTSTFSKSDGLWRKASFRPRCAMSSKTLFLTLALATGCLWAQDTKKEAPPATGATATAPQHPATISAEDKARKNPVKFAEVSVERGKKIYATQCSLCHGDKGDGKSQLAEDMKLQMPDFTKADTLKSRTDGELFTIISTGRDPMPSQAGRLTEMHRWNLVNYLRSLGGNVPEKSTGKEPEENVILVPQK
jgi:mono/diheme cytochrome c family protein